MKTCERYGLDFVLQEARRNNLKPLRERFEVGARLILRRGLPEGDIEGAISRALGNARQQVCASPSLTPDDLVRIVREAVRAQLPAEPVATSPSSDFGDDSIEALRPLLIPLTVSQRRAIVMFYCGSRSVDEISAETGIPTEEFGELRQNLRQEFSAGLANRRFRSASAK